MIKKSNRAEVNIEDMNLTKKEPSLCYPVIVDVILYKYKNIQLCNIY